MQGKFDTLAMILLDLDAERMVSLDSCALRIHPVANRQRRESQS